MAVGLVAVDRRGLPLALVLIGAKTFIVVAFGNEQLPKMREAVQVFIVLSVCLHSKTGIFIQN